MKIHSVLELGLMETKIKTLWRLQSPDVMKTVSVDAFVMMVMSTGYSKDLKHEMLPIMRLG